MAGQRINVDVVPQVARPSEVDTAIAEANELRARLRAAQEELAAAQATLERQEADDVANAAERARKGSPLGAIPASVDKARHDVDMQKRNAAAIGLASEAAQADVISAVHASAKSWITALNEERQRAEEQALSALDAFETACDAVNAAASAAGWVQSGVDGGAFPARVTGSGAVFFAPSSRKLTANSEPLSRQQVIAFARELIEPLPPKPTMQLRAAEPDAATSAA